MKHRQRLFIAATPIGALPFLIRLVSPVLALSICVWLSCLLLDLVSTQLFIEAGSVDEEGNVFFRALIKHAGFYAGSALFIMIIYLPVFLVFSGAIYLVFTYFLRLAITISLAFIIAALLIALANLVAAYRNLKSL